MYLNDFIYQAFRHIIRNGAANKSLMSPYNPMNNNTLLVLICATLLFQDCSQSEKEDELKRNVPDLFSQASANYQSLMMNLPDSTFPRSFENDTLITSGSEWWCSGFYPGTLLNIFEETGDSVLFIEALRMLRMLEKEQYNRHTHDLGFMMFCSFGNANRIAPAELYDEILINSAKSLSTRFDPAVGCIRSWDSEPEDFLVIIDNMMNLELLFRATKETGDSSFYNIAVTHADNTIKNHFREDNSSWHVLNYDPETGAIQQKRTAQGLSDSSAWARGQAWGLYGFTVTYRETRDEKYLKQAEKIADFILNHPNLPENKIPYWDFDVAGGKNTLRDASAAAIMASALLELREYASSPELTDFYLQNARQILTVLSSDEYLAKPAEKGGFLIKHGVGHLPAGSEVDVPLTYADYYYIEALKRYQKLP